MITRTDVHYIAALARIHISDQEADTFATHLESILHYVEKLNELNVEGVVPTSHALPLTNVFRKDIVMPSLPQKEAVAISPHHKDGVFTVPQIIE